MSFRIGEAFVEIGAKVNEKAIENTTDIIQNRLRTAINNELDHITNFGHTAGTKMALAAQAGFMAVGVGLAAGVDTSLREVNTLFGQTGVVGDENLAWIREGAYELSRELGITQRDIVPGLYQSISAGIPRDNVFDFMNTASRLAIGGVASTEESVDLLTTVINAFGLDVGDAEQIADKLFQTVADGKTTIPELAAAMFQVAPIANAAGVSLDEVNAATATLTSSGTPTNVAMTQVRSAITSLLNPTEDLAELFAENGYESGAAAIEALGLQGALELVYDAAEGDVGIMQQLMGRIEGVQATTALAGEGSGKYADALDNQADSAGNTSNAFEIMEGGVGAATRRLKTTMENFATVVGEALLPAINALSGILERITGWFSSMPKPIQQALAVLAFGLTALVPPLILFIKYWKMWQALKALTSIATMSKGLGHFGAQTAAAAKSTTMFKAATIIKKWAIGFVSHLRHPIAALRQFGRYLLTTPKKMGLFVKSMGAKALGAVKALWALIAANPMIVVIAAIAAAAYLIYKNWDSVKEFFGKLWEWFKTTLVWDWLLDAWDKISTAFMDAFGEIWEAIQDIWESISTKTSEVWGYIQDFLRNALEVIRNAVAVVLDWIQTAWEKWGQYIWNIVSTIFGFIRDTIITVIDIIKNIIMLFLNLVRGEWGAAWDNIKNIFGAVWDWIVSLLTGVLDVIVNMLGLAWDVITSAVTAAWEGIKSFFSGVWDWITNLFSSKSDEGEGILARAWEAIRDMIDSVWNSIKYFFGSILEAIWGLFPGWLQNMFKSIFDTYTRIYETIFNILTAVFGFIFELFNNIFEFVSSILSDIWHIISNTFMNILAIITNILRDVFNVVWEKFTEIFDTVKEWVLKVYNYIKERFTIIYEFYKAILQHIWDAVSSAFMSVYNTIRDWILKAYNYIKERFEAVLRFYAELISRITAAVVKFIKPVYDKVKEWIDKAKKYIEDQWNKVVKFFSRLKGRISSATRGIFDGIKDAFRAALNWIIDRWNGISFGLPRMELPALMGGGTVGGQSFGVPKIPRLAEGGDILQSGVAMVGEEGPEFLRLPKGAQVRPLAAGPGGDTVENYTIEKVEIRASDLKEMNDIKEFFDTVKQQARAQPKGRDSWRA